MNETRQTENVTTIQGTFCACGHNVEWYYNVGQSESFFDEDSYAALKEVLAEEAERRFREIIADDCPQGELCCVYAEAEPEEEFRGWVRIANLPSEELT